MFEELCLVCGNHLPDSAQAYCSDDCQARDASSPSTSSSSSAVSSPQIAYTHGGDVPLLVPSALGSALHHYASNKGMPQFPSSSASSTSWSLLTDEEDDDSGYGKHGIDYYHHDTADSTSDNGFTAGHLASALSYARRPSGTNNRATVTNPYGRAYTGSAPKYAPGAPRSAPIRSHPPVHDEGHYSDLRVRSSDGADSEEHELSEKSWVDSKPKYPASKATRNRNRSSLPACFSMLQIKSPSKDVRPSPVSSSSGTVARPSPPTPKLTLSTRLSQAEIAPIGVHATVFTTLRGRRPHTDQSRGSRRSGRSSPSPSSRSRSRRAAGGNPRISDRTFARDSSSQLSIDRLPDLSSSPDVAPPRGRTAVRRNSSPPPPGVVDPFALAAAMSSKIIGRSPSTGPRSPPRTRGRVGVEGLGGRGRSSEAPGYGTGRSGLVDRERVAVPYHLARIPL